MKNHSAVLLTLKDSLFIDTVTVPDIITLIIEHHNYLDQNILILKDKKASSKDKINALCIFLTVLEMHAKAEEETFYTGFYEAREQSIRVEGMSAQKEHDLADKLATELKYMDFEKDWTEEIDSKAIVLAGLVKNHIKMEEEEMFPMARKFATKEELKNLSVVYLEKCKEYLEIEEPIASRTSATTQTYL